MSKNTLRWQRGLYFVTPELADTRSLATLVEQALAGGAVLLQYRNKCADAELSFDQATMLRALAARAGVPFIVNDDAALARAVEADGVHLGRDDGDIAAARAILRSDAIIGVSCYDSIERARTAAANGADYLAFGAMFASRTKPNAPSARTAVFQQAAALGLPRVAIGGINLDNARLVLDAGADLIAVVSAIADAPEPLAVAAQLAALFTSNGSSQKMSSQL